MLLAKVDYYSGSVRLLTATTLRNITEGFDSPEDAGKYWKILASLGALRHGCIRSQCLQMLATRYWEEILSTK